MESGFEPKILICVECGQEFVFTANAQEYFAGKGYTEDPKRCKHCYMQHKREKRSAQLVPEPVEIDSAQTAQPDNCSP